MPQRPLGPRLRTCRLPRGDPPPAVGPRSDHVGGVYDDHRFESTRQYALITLTGRRRIPCAQLRPRRSSTIRAAAAGHPLVKPKKGPKSLDAAIPGIYSPERLV